MVALSSREETKQAVKKKREERQSNVPNCWVFVWRSLLHVLRIAALCMKKVNKHLEDCRIFVLLEKSLNVVEDLRWQRPWSAGKCFYVLL